MLSAAMPLRILRFACWPALAASGAVAACSNSSPPPADAFVNATISPTAADPAICNTGSQTPMLQIGTATAGSPTRVNDGDTQNGAQKVQVSCTVTPSGGGFDIKLQATESGAGTLIITSPPGQGAVTNQGGQNITGVWESQDNGTYRESDCTLSYTYNGAPVSISPPIAAGRIWAHISCPNAQLGGVTKQLPDGGTTDVTCDNEADFLFENCAQ
jgi:hypothetical protein